MNKVGWRVLVDGDWSDNSQWRYLIADEGTVLHDLLEAAVASHEFEVKHRVTLVDSFGGQTEHEFTLHESGTTLHKLLQGNTVRESITVGELR